MSSIKFIVVAVIIRNIYIFVFVEICWADVIRFTSSENLTVLKGFTDKLRCDNGMFNWFSWLMNSSEAWTMVLPPGMKLIHLHNNEWMNITINTSFFLCLPSFVLFLSSFNSPNPAFAWFQAMHRFWGKTQSFLMIGHTLWLGSVLDGRSFLPYCSQQQPFV